MGCSSLWCRFIHFSVASIVFGQRRLIQQLGEQSRPCDDDKSPLLTSDSPAGCNPADHWPADRCSGAPPSLWQCDAANPARCATTGKIPAGPSGARFKPSIAPRWRVRPSRYRRCCLRGLSPYHRFSPHRESLLRVNRR